MITRQEMFDRAWNGLKSQGWIQATNHGGSCVYQTTDGKRCAWGWVDPSLSWKHNDFGGFGSLREDGVGVAKDLSDEDADFAANMQVAHDCGGRHLSPQELEQRMRDFAKRYDLTVPE